MLEILNKQFFITKLAYITIILQINAEKVRYV